MCEHQGILHPTGSRLSLIGSDEVTEKKVCYLRKRLTVTKVCTAGRKLGVLIFDHHKVGTDTAQLPNEFNDDAGFLSLSAFARRGTSRDSGRGWKFSREGSLETGVEKFEGNCRGFEVRDQNVAHSTTSTYILQVDNLLNHSLPAFFVQHLG